MGPKLAILLLFFAVTLGVGIYCRRHTTNIGDFVLGGRNVGAWLTAFLRAFSSVGRPCVSHPGT